MPGAATAAVQLTAEERKKELAERLEGYKKVLSGSVSLRHTLLTKNRDIIIAWAQDLEEGRRYGLYDGPTNSISGFIRRSLIELGLEQCVAYAREVLPGMYKRHDENPDTEDFPRYNSSINTIIDYAKENAEEILFTSERIAYWESHKVWLQNHPFLSLLDYDEYRADKEEERGLRKFAGETKDKRWGVPVAFHHLVNFLIEKAGINHATAIYGEKAWEEYHRFGERNERLLRRLKEMSTKQFRKIGIGEIAEIDRAYRPRNRMEATESGFLGIQCHNLHWRVKERYNTDRAEWQFYCHDCRGFLDENEIKMELPAVTKKQKESAKTMSVKKDGSIELSDFHGNSYTVNQK